VEELRLSRPFRAAAAVVAAVTLFETDRRRDVGGTSLIGAGGD